MIPPTRWLFSTLAPIMLMVYAIKRKAVSKSGAVLGIIIAIILSIASHAFFASLVVFFFTSSRATRFRGEMKRSFEADHKGGNLLGSVSNLLPDFLFLPQAKERETGLKSCATGAWPLNWLSCISSTAEVASVRLIFRSTIGRAGWESES